MNIIISNSSYKPIYEQVVDAFKKAIMNNELKEGEILPSVRSLANDLKISFLTVKKAYDILEKDGYTKTVPGKGSFVFLRKQEIDNIENMNNIDKVKEYLKKAKNISDENNISKEDLIRMIDNIYKEEK